VTATSAWSAAGALWVGCLLGLPPWSALLGAGLLGLAAIMPSARIGRGARSRAEQRRLVVVLVALTLLGGGLAGGRAVLADRGAVVHLADRGGAAELTATVVTEVRVTEHGGWAVLRVTELGGERVRERAAVRLPDGVLPDVGDVLRGSFTARPLGDDGFDAHLRRLHAGALLAPVGEIGVRTSEAPVWRVTALVRARARQVAEAHLDTDRAAILTGLLTGDVRGQSPERRQQLAAAGLTHLVVVSGRHVGLVLAGVIGAAVVLGAGARGRRLTALAALGWYVVLVRWQPSVLRAGVMASLVLGAGLLGRRADARHSLAMAVIVLLLVDPLLAGHLGFGLSVTATAGVLVVAPRLAPRLPGPRAVRLLTAACVGAQVGAAPLLLTLEQGMTWRTVPANLLAVPLAAAAQAIGLLAVLVGLVWPTGGALLAATAGPPVGGILGAAAWATEGGRVDARLLTSGSTGALVAVLAAALLLRRRAPRVGVAGLAGAVALAAVPAVQGPADVVHLTITALDVGQGDAILLEVPDPSGGTARMLVDGGPEPGVALARLRERGIRELDVVVVSHPHHDHTGGLPEVLLALPVSALLVGPTPLAPDVALSAAETERVAAGLGIPMHRIAAGDGFSLGAAQVRVLSPPRDGSLSFDRNEDSVVLHVAVAEGGALLTGDAEVIAQERLLREPWLLRAAILKVPHHGAATNAPGFLAAVGASDALIGVGEGNDYAHPHPLTLAELAGRAIHRTDTDGTVSLSVTSEGVVRRRPPRRVRRHLHCRPCRGPPCTCSPAPRSSSCAAPPTSSSTSSAATTPTASSWSTFAPASSGRTGFPTCGPARSSAAPAPSSSARRRTSPRS
jgi:competence protein ComEC